MRTAATIGTHYYKSALASVFGTKVHGPSSLLPLVPTFTNEISCTAFYTNTSKQVLEVHEEATRIKESKKAAASPSTASSAVADQATTVSDEGARAAESVKGGAQKVVEEVKAKTG